MHPTGDVLYNDQTTGSLMRVDHVTLERRVVLAGLSEPDGLEVDLDGFAYVAEQAAGRIRRIDSDTGEFIILTEELGRPNGLSFNPTYDLLYVADWNDGYIHAIEVAADGTPGAVYPFAGVVGTGMYDGMGVDACGNVYVCDYGATSVYRITEDGSTWDVIADLGADSTWIPNMQWGSGIGGWDAHALYVTDIMPTLTYEVHVGVASKPLALFP
jgi:sugar lactone lactonase YvrE